MNFGQKSSGIRGQRSQVREFVSPPMHLPHVPSNLGVETRTLHHAGEFCVAEQPLVRRGWQASGWRGGAVETVVDERGSYSPGSRPREPLAPACRDRPHPRQMQ